LNREEPSIEEILEEIVANLARDFRRLIYPRKHLDRLQSLDTPAEKAVYLLFLVAQPQTFGSTRSLLRLSTDTVNRALKKLMASRYIELDENFLYWILE